MTLQKWWTPMRDPLSPRGAGLEASAAPQPPAPGVYPPPAAYPPQPEAYPPAQGQYPPLPGAYAPPVAMTVVTTPGRPSVSGGPPAEDPEDRYRPDIKPPSPVWKAIKWPLRKALLGLYITIQGARRHKAVALVVVVLMVALVGTAVIVRQLTLPPPPALAIDQPALPALPASVISYLHGQKTFNGQEMWNSLDAAARTQTKGTESDLQTTLDQERAQGLQITRFIYSGGYQAADGTSHYTIEAQYAQSSQTGALTLYFTVGSDGLISSINTL